MIGTVRQRLARLEERHDVTDGRRFVLVPSIDLTAAEIRLMLAAVDGLTRGLPSSSPHPTFH